MTEGVCHIAVPGFDVWCIEDGTYTFDAADFPGLAYDEQQTRLEAAGETEIRTVFNTFLIRDAGKSYTLVDTGCGTVFGAQAGRFATRLTALGVKPDDIARVFFTHLHTDHCGGALREGVPVFPNAEVFLHAAELAHWKDQNHFARDVLAAYTPRIQTVAEGEAIAPGLEVWELAGHTPGHCGLCVGPRLVLLGDILHSEALQLGEPRLSSENDVDAWQAAECRLDTLREVAESGLIFSGGHVLGPQKFVQLVEVGDGFAAVPL